MLDDVFEKFKERLTSLDHVWLNPQAFSDAVHAKGAALENCWGFIDGTVRRIARPIRNQRVMFSGHKRVHCIKFQVSNDAKISYCYDYFYSLVSCSSQWIDSSLVWSN